MGILAQVLETMRRAGLSQRTMTDIVDLSPQRVQQLLSGKATPAHRGRRGRRKSTPAA